MWGWRYICQGCGDGGTSVFVPKTSLVPMDFESVWSLIWNCNIVVFYPILFSLPGSKFLFTRFSRQYIGTMQTITSRHFV